jgi:hypothetical protein
VGNGVDRYFFFNGGSDGDFFGGDAGIDLLLLL